jgi:iron(III) transport system substrate-binding protein
MKKKFAALALAMLMLLSLAACGEKATDSAPAASSGSDSAASESTAAASGSDVSGSVMLYATLKEAQLTALKEAFSKAYPNITLDYYAAGAGTVMTKIATEQQSGQIGCDVVWVGEPTNIMTLKAQDILMPYESPEAANIPSQYIDPDNTYIGARLVVMGISYNTALVPEDQAPTKWEDLLNDTFTDQIILTDAVESGTMAYALGALVQNDQYGWDFFQQLKDKQHAVLNSSATGTHNDIAAGAYLATIGVDYVTQTLSDAGSPIQFVYPEENAVVISGPMAIMKGTRNEAAAKVFYDWVLSKDGQQVLADSGATPIRVDVTRAGSKPVSEIAAMENIDDVLMNEQTDSYFDQFDGLFK